MSKYDPMDYRNPWEDVESGCWIIKKGNGVTSMRKLREEELTKNLEDIQYVMAICYDKMIEEIHKLQESGKPFSIHDMVISTIQVVGLEASKRKLNESKI